MEVVRASDERGRYVGATRVGLEAGLAALEGRRDEAITLYRSAADTFRDLDSPLDLGRSQMEYAILVGPDDPGARAAADEARAILTRLGSPPLLERLELGLRRWQTDGLSEVKPATGGPTAGTGAWVRTATGGGDRTEA